MQPHLVCRVFMAGWKGASMWTRRADVAAASASRSPSQQGELVDLGQTTVGGGEVCEKVGWK